MYSSWDERIKRKSLMIRKTIIQYITALLLESKLVDSKKKLRLEMRCIRTLFKKNNKRI